MKLKYRARTKEGELQVGLIEAASKEAAVNTLSLHNLFVLSLEPAEKKMGLERVLNIFNRVSTKNLMIFTRQFAALLEAKIALSEALQTLEKQTKNQILKKTIFEIVSDIDAGLSLSQALEKYGNVFSPFYINLIRSAEITGRLEEAVGFLADYLEKEVIFVNKIRSSLIYPIIVIGLFFVVVGVMASVVLPNIEPFFQESGVEVPAFTKVIITTGKFLSQWWWIIIILLVTVGILIADYIRTSEGRAVLDELVLRMPIFGNLLKQIYVVRFAESVSILIKGGIPITQTLNISSVTIGSTIYKDLLLNVAEDVRRGELMSQSLAKNERYFPPLVSQMVAIGESTGRLEQLLEKVSIFYTREVDNILNNLVELIQPVLILVIGALVGALFASILIPVFNLVKAF